jgi:hypothetical protein
MSKLLLLLSLLLSLLAAGLFAQGTTSRVVGTVQDPTGAAVVGATVRLVNEGTNATFTGLTSDTGTYAFEAVQSGIYRVEVEAAGFRKFASRGNQVAIGQPTTVNVNLEVGALAEEVTVTGTAEAVQTSTSGNYGNLFQGDVIRSLPIVGNRGRNLLNLVLLQPGVVSGSNVGGGVHVHGARDRAWNYTLDGIDINETSMGGGNSAPLRTNPDSVAEFRVLTSNTTAEYGRNSGGQVAMITRSGTNEFHGGMFWFYRTPSLNANEWEYNIDDIGKRQFVQHTFGGTLGGPIVKNKTFFFANVQLLRALQTGSVSRTVYTEQARQGIFRYVKNGRNRPAGADRDPSVDASGNVLSGVDIGTYNVAANDPQHFGLDPTISSLIGRSPLPNNFTGGDGLNTALYIFAAAEQEKQRDLTFKVDHILNPQNTVFARIAWGRQDTLCDGANDGEPAFPGEICGVDTQRGPRNLAFNWRANPNAHITNELVIGHNRFVYNFLTPGQTIDNIWIRNTPVTVPGILDYGNLRTLSTFQAVDNFAYQRGAHSLKFGFNFRFQRHLDERGSVAAQNIMQAIDFSTSVNTVDPATFGLPADLNATYDRPTVQSGINLLLGRVGTMTRAFVAKGDQYVSEPYKFDARYPEYDIYAQDNWKVSRNFTVDFGLRWEVKLTPSDADGNVMRPNQAVVAGAAPSNTLRWEKGELFHTNWTNFGPSIGIAWDPFGDGKTSLRTNYRIAYDRIPTFLLSSAVFQNLPGLTVSVVNEDYGQSGGRLASMPKLTPPATKPSDLTQPIPFSGNTMTVVDPNLKTPTTHQWAFSIQREIMRNTVLDVSYIGRRGYHLFGAYNANQVDIFGSGFLDAFNTVKAGGESALINGLTAADSRRLANESGSQMIRRLYASDLNLNSVAGIAGAIATRLQGGRSVTDLSGAGPFALLSYPQFSSMRVFDSNDFSTYHALEVQLERRLTSSLSYQVSYTFAKSLDSGSFDPTQTVYSTGNSQGATSTPFDINNRKLNYGRSDFDRTHAFQTNWFYALPFGKGKRLGSNVSTAVDNIIGGWEIGGFLRYIGGRPFTVFSGAYSFGNVVQSFANCTGCSKSDGGVFNDADSGMVWFFNQAERATLSAPAAGELGDTGRNFFTGPRSFQMDMSATKRLRIKERFDLEFRADAQNLTNTPTFGAPTATFTSSIFGRIRNSVVSGSRKVQLGMKLNF